MFAHSRRDAWLVLVSLLGVASLAAPLAAGPSLAVALVAVALNVTNYQCVAHYFLHVPFFRGRALNVAFSLLNTLALGVPQTLYRAHHLNHHRFNNDVAGKDRSSTYRFGREGRHEALLRYALLGPFRTEFGVLFREVRAAGALPLALAETALLTGTLAAYAWVAPRTFLFWYVPVWYAGQALALAENYLEHWGARPGDRLADSVSAYAGWYNRIWFNNGFHQEHHWRPQVHWTHLPSLRGEMLPDDQRRALKQAHWANWPAA